MGGDNRKKASKDPVTKKMSAGDEAAFLKQLEALVADGSSVRGRDTSVISAEAEEIEKQMNEAGEMSAKGREKAKEHLEEIKAADAFERNSGKLIKYAMLICTVLPMVLTGLGSVQEWATRPAMVAAPADLSGKLAVVTGGCGAMGFELALMLAESGAGVVLGCHGVESSEAASEQAMARVDQLGLRRTDDGDFQEDSSRGWVEVWPLSLESFSSVRTFAARVAAVGSSLDLLVHNGGSKQGCTRSEDGHEYAVQVNYLAPVLLTKLLLPSLPRGGRVVHVTCDAALQLPDYLPWPLSRTTAATLPRIKLESLDVREEGKVAGSVAGGCSAPLEYASAKLALTLHSAELHRRLSLNRTGSVSHALNPGAMLSDFHRNSPPAAAAPSAMGMMSGLRGMLMSYFPPVWIMRKLYGLVFTQLANAMLRESKTGARAAFHVATAAALGLPKAGGGVFSDQAGAFADCGGAPAQCGRMAPDDMPAAAANLQLAKQLWVRTEQAIGAHALRPLAGGDGEADAFGGGDAGGDSFSSAGFDDEHWATDL